MKNTFCCGKIKIRLKFASTVSVQCKNCEFPDGLEFVPSQLLLYLLHLNDLQWALVKAKEKPCWHENLKKIIKIDLIELPVLKWKKCNNKHRAE